MTDTTDRVYIAKRELNGEYIAIEHGTTGYSPTTVYDQDHANVLNERQGITPAMVEAAMMCSMFDNWNRFESLTAMHESRKPDLPQSKLGA